MTLAHLPTTFSEVPTLPYRWTYNMQSYRDPVFCILSTLYLCAVHGDEMQTLLHIPLIHYRCIHRDFKLMIR